MKLSASLLSANFSNLKSECSKVKRAGASLLHIDVIDGNFAPNITFGSVVTKSLENEVSLEYDVHLMINDPKKYMKDFFTKKTRFITFHYEAVKDEKKILSLIKFIKKNNFKAGLSINPSTKVKAIEKFLPFLDQVLIMSVWPGFSGQSYIDGSEKKVKTLNDLRVKNNYGYEISIDGGIDFRKAGELKKVGLDIFVMGSFLFNNIKTKKGLDSFRGKVKTL